MEEKISYHAIEKWKTYLYSLKRRIRIFQQININKITFKLLPGEIYIIKNLIKRFGKGGVLHKVKAYWYDEYISICEQNQSRISNKEYRIAVKLSGVKKLNLKELYMEVSELKKFGKEVGLKYADMKGMDAEDLIDKIIQEVNSTGQESFSDEFVEWWENLDEKFFKKAEKSDKKDEKEPEEDVDFDELIEVIEDAEDIETLVDVCDAYDFFSKKTAKIKDLEEMQEKMLEEIEAAMEKPEEEKEEEKEEEVTDEVKEELIEVITESDDVDELKELIGEFPIFADVSTRGRVKAETLKEKMLKVLGVKEEKKLADKETTEANTLEELVEEWENTSLPKLKKVAKEMGVKVKIGQSKEALMELMAEKYEETGGKVEAKEKEEAGITPTMIQDLVKEKDIDALVGIAKDMDIKLNVLQNKSAKRAGEKILSVLSEEKAKPEEKKEIKRGRGRPPKAKEEKAVSKASIYETVRQMMKKDESKFKIQKAVLEIAKDKDKDWAKNVVPVLMEVIELDN